MEALESEGGKSIAAPVVAALGVEQDAAARDPRPVETVGVRVAAEGHRRNVQPQLIAEAVGDHVSQRDRAQAQPVAVLRERVLAAPWVEERREVLREVQQRLARSEERRVGKEGVGTGRSRWSP